VRVAIADDSALLRQGLGRLLADDGWQITASVGDGTALLRAIDTDPPDGATTRSGSERRVGPVGGRG
jgi:DNA-binding NarL/FixJ family response regulator